MQLFDLINDRSFLDACLFPLTAQSKKKKKELLLETFIQMIYIYTNDIHQKLTYVDRFLILVLHLYLIYSLVQVLLETREYEWKYSNI